MFRFQSITEDNFKDIVALKRPEGENFFAPMCIRWRRSGCTGMITMFIHLRFMMTVFPSDL